MSAQTAPTAVAANPEEPITMLAAITEAGNKSNLVLKTNVPIPKPGEGQVLIQLEACGLCHSDVSRVTAQDDFGAHLPSVPAGHEGAGYIAAYGPSVSSSIYPQDQLYALYAIEEDQDTHSTFMLSARGFVRPGMLAEFVVVDVRDLLPVPKGIPAPVAAIATDAVATAYHAVTAIANIQKGEKVIIFGVGGVGQNAVALAKHIGATVYAIDVKPGARQLALDLGADEAWTYDELEAKLGEGFWVHCTIDCWGSKRIFELSISAVKATAKHYPVKGRIVLVGISEVEPLTIDPLFLVTTGIPILPSVYATKEETLATLNLIAAGVLKPTYTLQPLEKVTEAWLKLAEGKAPQGRQVLIPPKSSITIPSPN